MLTIAPNGPHKFVYTPEKSRLGTKKIYSLIDPVVLRTARGRCAFVCSLVEGGPTGKWVPDAPGTSRDTGWTNSTPPNEAITTRRSNMT